MKHILFVFLICCQQLSVTQNLINNGDFELYNELPSQREQWFNCKQWNNITNGKRPTPDYYHTNATGPEVRLPDATRASVRPFSGDAIMGINTYVDGQESREYISTSLTESMQIGERYKVSLWVTNGYANWEYAYTSNGLGVALSTFRHKQADDEGPIDYQPQFEIDEVLWETEWRKFTFTMVANDEFDVITIGNFRGDAETQVVGNSQSIGTFGIAYYFIDKVSIEHIPRLEIYGEQNVCRGDSVKILAKNDSIFSWYEASNPSNILSTDSLIWVVADKNTTYIVEGTEEVKRLSLFVTSAPEVELGNDFELCNGRSLELDAYYPSTEFVWSNGSKSDKINVNESGEYWVSLDNGCGPVSDTITATFIECPCFVEFPNAFTPNNDGLNDDYKPSYDCQFESFFMQIIDRWGYVVFETDNVVEGWDGTIKGKNPSAAGYYRCVGKYTHIETWTFNTGLLLVR